MSVHKNKIRSHLADPENSVRVVVGPGVRVFIFFFYLRIEMQIFSLHRMMQNIRLFNVCEARRASRRH